MCSNLITPVSSQALFTFVYSPPLCKTLIAIAACRRVIAENVSQAVAVALKEKLRKKAYLMPSSVAIPEVSGVSGVSGQNRETPKYTPEAFVLCQPRSNLELPLKETTVKQGKALLVSFEHDGEAMSWGKMEKKHNDEFNPSGQPWSPDQGQKRVAETDLAVGEKVVVEPVSPPELLVPTGVSDVSGVWQIMLDPNEGTLFLKALKDGAVTNEAKLFSAKGAFRTASAAQAEMAKAGAQFIDSSMTANTMVLAEQAGTLELPQHPVPLGSLLKVLASLRAPVGEIFKHKHQQKDGAFEIKASEPIAFVLEINNKPVDPKKVIEPGVLSTYVDVTKIKHVQAVQIVKYEPRLHLIIELILLQMHIGAAVEKIRWATINASCF